MQSIGTSKATITTLFPFHICFSHFDFSIIKTYDGNSGVTHYLPTQNVIHKIISLPKLSFKTNTPSGMPIVIKTMNQISPCVYTRYNENMYKKHVGLGDVLHFSFGDCGIVIFFF